MKKIALLAVITLTLLSCSKEKAGKAMACGPQVVISSEQYSNINEDIHIQELTITGDCLKIKFSASGCSGDDWELQLIDSGILLESDPPQRNLKLELTNPELCEAYITKEVTFDISNLQVSGNEVLLNITNSDHSILYEY